MICRHPVSETVKDHPLNDRVVAVKGIAASGKIKIMPVRSQHVIDIIIDPLEGKSRSVFISFRGMIEYHIQQNINVIFVAGLDQLPEFGSFTVIFYRRCIAGIRCKKGYRIISPVIHQLSSVKVPVVESFIKFKDGHEFESIHAKFLKIRDLFHDPGKCTAFFPGSRGRILGKAPDMHLIDYEILHGFMLSRMSAPVKIVLDHTRLVYG